MGMKLFSTSSYDNSTPAQQNNPDPKVYTILRSEHIGNHLIIVVNYPNCTNYEGTKILMYSRVTLEQLKKYQSTLDPHFSKNKQFHSPIARFEPTQKGLQMAIELAELLR